MQNQVVVYDNGELELKVSVENESVWLNRVQMAELFDRDIKTIGKHINNDLATLLDTDRIDNIFNVGKDDSKKGYIYILKSLSNDDRITTKRNLYKIGFSTIDVETRIKNAKLEPTYLMADVAIVSSFEVYNINPHKLEQLIHKFFSYSCLDIDIVDAKGDIYKPREWFIVPLDVIEEVIELIISAKIINYKYDIENEKIISI